MNSKIALALLVALAIGGAIGYLVAPVSTPVIESVDGPATGLHDRSDEQEGTARFVPGEGSRRRATESVAARLAPVVPAQAIDAAIERAAPVADRESRGTGRVSGRVVESDGDAVAGVSVYTVQQAHRFLKRPARLDNPKPLVLRSIAEELDAAAQLWAEGRSSVRVGVTDAEGRFALDGLEAAGNVWLQAYREGFVVEAVSASAASDEEMELLARRIVPVVFTVLDADGEELEHATLCIQESRSPVGVEWRRDEPVVELLEGRTSVRAATGIDGLAPFHLREIEHHARTVSPLATVEVEEPHQRVVLQMSEQTGLLVQLQPSAPLPLDFSMQLRLTGAEGRLYSMRHSSRGVNAHTESIAFSGLDPGAYRLELGSGGRRDSRSAIVAEVEVDYVGGLQEVELLIPEVIEVPPIRVQVIAPDGGLVDEGLQFYRTVRSEGGSSSFGLFGRRLAGGWLEIENQPRFLAKDMGVQEEAPTDEEVLIAVEHPLHGSAEAPWVPNQVEYRLAFEPVGRLAVTVSGDAPSAETYVRVRVEPLSEAAASSPQWTARRGRIELPLMANGSCSFEALPLGDCVVSLVSGRTELGRTQVRVVEGENVADLPRHPTYELLLHCPNLAPGTRVLVNPIGDARWTRGGTLEGTTDETRHLRFEDVLGGRYRVSVDRVNRDIDVPCGTVTIDARSPNAIRISVHTHDGLMARLGFEDGDVVVGLDGVRLADRSDLGELVRELGRADLDLTIERAGQRMDVVAPDLGIDLLQAADTGGAYRFVVFD